MDILEREEEKATEQEKEDESVIRGRIYGSPLGSLSQVFPDEESSGGEI